MIKSQKGITLVALIITIIVMLILAGVSISLVLDEGGVLKQAQGVEGEQVEGAIREAIALANSDMIAEFYSDTSSYSAATAAAIAGKTEDEAETARTELMQKRIEDAIERNRSGYNITVSFEADGTGKVTSDDIYYSNDTGDLVNVTFTVDIDGRYPVIKAN